MAMPLEIFIEILRWNLWSHGSFSVGRTAICLCILCDKMVVFKWPKVR